MKSACEQAENIHVLAIYTIQILSWQVQNEVSTCVTVRWLIMAHCALQRLPLLKRVLMAALVIPLQGKRACVNLTLDRVCASDEYIYYDYTILSMGDVSTRLCYGYQRGAVAVCALQWRCALLYLD